MPLLKGEKIMLKQSMQTIQDIFKKIGVDNLFIQGDNSNFFQVGDNIRENAVIFDDANEIMWAIRLSQDVPNYQYRISGLDYDEIQYLSCGASRQQIEAFLKLFGMEDEYKRKFPKSKLDKGLYEHVNVFNQIKPKKNTDKNDGK